MLYRNSRGERQWPRDWQISRPLVDWLRVRQRAHPLFASLPLRLSVLFVALLMAAALGVGYLFDRGRTEALEQRSLSFLRLHAERAADDLERRLERLQRDALFLARTPAVRGVRADMRPITSPLAERGADVHWRQLLRQLFIAFADSRPDYCRLQVIGAADGLEQVRVERLHGELRVAPQGELADKGGRYYVRKALALPEGGVYLSRIDLKRIKGTIQVPHMPVVRAAAPVRNDAGQVVGVLVVDMDVRKLLDGLRLFMDGGETAYLVDDRGDFLLHPDPARTFGRDLGHGYALKDAFPRHAAAIAAVQPGRGAFFRFIAGPEHRVGYVVSRRFPAGDPGFRLDLILTQSEALISADAGHMRENSLLWMGVLLAAAIALVGSLVFGLTRSLRALAKAAEGIAAGDYQVRIPAPGTGEVGALAVAFRHMVGDVQSRERALARLNEALEQRVEERTEELRRQQGLRHLILENIADGVVVADVNGRFLLWNRGAERIAGRRLSDFPIEQWSERFGVFRNESGNLVPVDELPLVRAMRGEATDQAQLYVQCPSGKTGRWVTVTGRPLRGPTNRIEGGVVTLVDITAHKQLQRRLDLSRRQLRRVGRLALTAEIAAAAAHQLSQPIAAMANYAAAAERLLRTGQLTGEPLRELVGEMNRVIGRAAETLDSLRALIRRRKAEPKVVDVNELVWSMLLFFEARLREDQVEVVRNLGPDVPPVSGDFLELGQMLIQLLSNALDALQERPQGQRRLLVGTEFDPEAAMVIIRVADSGAGVSPRVVDSLFEPWVTSKQDALGIGLSIVRTIVENHRGRIELEPTDPSGAVFRIVLPAMLTVS